MKPNYNINHGHINTGPMTDERETALKELKAYKESHSKPWYLR